MNFFRNQWFNIGIVFALIIGVFLFIFGNTLSSFQFLLWISFISLLLHQFEEYGYPGYFPGVINKVLFSSKYPDRYPLNTNTAFIVNVLLGWTLYLFSAVFAERTLWLAIAAILVSCGNVIAHTLLFNIRGKTIYNPGMLTALVLFLPISVYFFIFITRYNLANVNDYLIGIPLGLAINYFGIIKLIIILKNKQTIFIFPKRFVRSYTRQK